MLLRLILISVVSAMGLNLPSAREWDDLAASGHAWIQEAIARVDALMPAGELAFEPPAAVAEVAKVLAPTDNPDWAFDAIVDQMASTFANPPAPVVEVVPADAAEVLGAGSGLPELVAPATSDISIASAVAEAIAIEPAPVESPAARISRIDLAIRLTREAMGAWSRVFEPAPRMASMSR
jgi:hypothetical protein